jgi:hypothetical protein
VQRKSNSISREYAQLGLVTNNRVKFHQNPPAVLEMKCGQAYFAQKRPLRSHNYAKENSSRMSREYAQLGLVTNNPMKFH